MSVIHVLKSSDPYARVPKSLLKDPRLSWKAKGVMSYLLGKPRYWEVRTGDLVNQSTDGAHAIYSALKELREFGYATLQVVRGEGRIKGSRWVVCGFPQFSNQDGGFQDTEKLNSEKGHLTKNEGTKNDGYRMPSGQRRPNGFLLDNGDIPSPKIVTKLHLAVEEFARFSISRGFHVRKKNIATGQIDYAKGAQAHSWSPQTLTAWESYYGGLLERVGSKDTILNVLRWYIQNLGKDEYLVAYHTFPRFCEKFESIERSMKISKKENQKKGEGNVTYRLGKDSWEAVYDDE